MICAPVIDMRESSSVLTEIRVIDRLRKMESSPEQLSLPLFDSEPDELRPSTPRLKDGPPRRRVVSSRSETQPIDVSADDEPPTASSTAPTLLTTQEAADALHVHPRTVQRLVERGQLSAVHLGTAVRFDPADIAELTDRLKRRASALTPSPTEVVRPSRAVRVSFADRLRSQQDEHRAA
jgi:excisionase family DNA binding protein